MSVLTKIPDGRDFKLSGETAFLFALTGDVLIKGTKMGMHVPTYIQFASVT